MMKKKKLKAFEGKWKKEEFSSLFSLCSNNNDDAKSRGENFKRSVKYIVSGKTVLNAFPRVFL